MAVQYDLEGQRRIYARWAPVYDRVYHKLLSDAHRRTAQAAAACGPDILEVGVGTGLVLPYYPPHARVVGVDLSEHMLAKPWRRFASARCPTCNSSPPWTPAASAFPTPASTRCRCPS
jgi:SAM-dependent methyltransferase